MDKRIVFWLWCAQSKVVFNKVSWSTPIILKVFSRWSRPTDQFSLRFSKSFWLEKLDSEKSDRDFHFEKVDWSESGEFTQCWCLYARGYTQRVSFSLLPAEIGWMEEQLFSNKRNWWSSARDLCINTNLKAFSRCEWSNKSIIANLEWSNKSIITNLKFQQMNLKALKTTASHCQPAWNALMSNLV